MKKLIIQKLEIKSFGKLSNKIIDLTKDLNVVYGENEAGKSTTTNFIKFMLFGFDKKRVSANNPLSQKEKFIPWDGSNISGKLYCEYNGIDVIIERDYKKGDSLSKTKVYQKATGEELTEFKGVEPGLIFYNVGLETYENTAFILQNQLQTISTDEMELKLRNIASTGEDDTSYFKAKKSIEDELRIIENSKAGQIKDLQNKLNALQEQLIEAENSQQTLLSIENELICVKENLEKETIELKNLKIQKQNQTAFLANSKLEEIEIKEQELEVLYSRAKTVKRIIREKNISDENLDIVKQDIIDYQIIEGEGDLKADERKELISQLKIESDKLKEYSKITSNQTAIAQKLKQMASPLTYAILLIVTIASFALSPLLVFVPIPLGIIGLIMLVINLQKGFKKKELEEIGVKNVLELKNALKEIAILTQNIGNINAKISGLSPNMERSNKIMDKIVDYLKINRFSVDNVKNVIKVYENTLDELKNINVEIEKTEANISGLTSGISVDELKKKSIINMQNSEVSLENLEEMIAVKANIVLKLELENQRIAQLFKYTTQKSTPPYEIIQQQNEYSQKLQERKDRQKSLQIANKMLDIAYNTMQMVFAPELSRKAEKYFESFTKDNSRKLFFSKDNKVSVNSDNKKYMLDYFSTGTTDAIYIALRMAVCDIVYNKNRPLLIFDDTFSHFDNERLNDSIKSINTIKNNYQVIYFTCKQNELGLFENANIINI